MEQICKIFAFIKAWFKSLDNDHKWVLGLATLFLLTWGVAVPWTIIAIVLIVLLVWPIKN